jgi:hypothetical protein
MRDEYPINKLRGLILFVQKISAFSLQPSAFSLQPFLVVKEIANKL